MTWMIRWEVVERPSHLDPRHPSPRGTVSQGETVEFHLVSDVRTRAVHGRQPEHWASGPRMSVSGTTTVGRLPPHGLGSALIFRYRFRWPGVKRVRIAGRLRLEGDTLASRDRRTMGARVVPPPEDVAAEVEIEVIADAFTERGRIAATAGHGREGRALARAEDAADHGAAVTGRMAAAARPQRLDTFRTVRQALLRRRGLPARTPGIVPWPLQDEAGLRRLTDDEVAQDAYILTGLADPEVTPPIDLRPQAGQVARPSLLPLEVAYHLRTASAGGEVRLWRQPIAAGAAITGGERDHLTVRADDLLSVRYEHALVGLVPAWLLADEIRNRRLQALAWEVVTMVVFDIVVRIAVPPLWAALRVLRIVAGRLASRAAVAAARGTARLLDHAAVLEAALLERQAALLARAAREARGAGGRVVAATEREAVELAASGRLGDEAARGVAARGTSRPVVRRPDPRIPPTLEPGLVPAGAGPARPPVPSPADLGLSVLERNLLPAVQEAMSHLGISIQRLRRATPVRLGILMEGVALRLLRRGVITPLRRIRTWQVGRLGRYTQAIHEGTAAGVGQDLYGIGPQIREAAAHWRTAAADAAGPGTPTPRFTEEGANWARLAAPVATEIKTGNAEGIRAMLGEFGSGWQMDIDYVVDRWVRWSQGPGEQVVRQWIRERRLHPYWAHPEWVRSAAGREAFAPNRLVLVFSEYGSVDLGNRSAAGLAVEQVVRVAYAIE